MRLLTCVVLMAAIPLAGQAQSSVAGQWTVRYTRAFRNVHTGDTTVFDESGILSLHLQGDSVNGFWQTETRRDEPAAAVRPIHGTFRGDTLRVQLDPSPPSPAFFANLAADLVEWLKTHVHDMPTTIPAFELVVRGDSIYGTRRTVTLEGEIRGPAVKVTGSRTSTRK